LQLSKARKLEFFDELINNSNIAVLVVDKNRRIVFVNQKTCEMFGYHEDELIGKTTRIFHVSDETFKQGAKLLHEAAVCGGVVSLDYQWKRKDGSVFLGHIEGRVSNGNGEILWTLYDLSCHLQAETAQIKIRQQAQIIERISEAIITADLNGILTNWNQGATKLLGYKEDEILGKSIDLFCGAKDIKDTQSRLKDLQRYGNIKLERTMLRKDKTTVDVFISVSLLCNDNNEPTHMVGYIQDITLIKKAQKTILQADMFYALVENSFVAIYVISEGRLIYTNKRFQDMFGFSQQELQDKPILELVHPEDVRLVKERQDKRIQKLGLGLEYTFRAVKKSGEVLDAHVYGSSLMLDGGKKAIVGTLIDETDKNTAKKQLEFLANQDTLTELFNRNFFNLQLEHAIELAHRNKQKLALILFDIDNFKRINDSLGHDVGDLVIKEVAKRILKVLRSSDTFFRVGGDEFTILIENYKNINCLRVLVQKIENAMKKSIRLKHTALHISLSMGISLFPKNATDAISLQKTADLAMYEAKNRGKNNFVFYHKRDVCKIDAIKLENEMFEAFENGDFEMFLQPQISCVDEKLTGAEALIRWKHHSRGFMPPDFFLNLAEEVGLLYKLDLFMFEEALKFLKKHPQIDSLAFEISVNISNAFFLHHDFISFVKTLVRKYKKEAKHIKLELTEKIAMNTFTYSSKTVQVLKKLGFKISIDDFGTGYSSLSHLKKLDVDELKIDKSFIDDICMDQTDKSIVKAIIEMSRALSLKSVAEGVEDGSQLQLLKSMGCDTIQGYYFSKPLCKNEFEEKYIK